MTKSNNGPFTHHERLRYSYLLKNLAHLNGQQASEFNYLQGKLDAYEAERRYQAQREDYQAAWRQPYDNRYDYYQERDYEAANQLTEEGLPVYREEVAQSQPKRKRFKDKQPLQQRRLQSPVRNQPRRSDQRKREGSRRLLNSCLVA